MTAINYFEKARAGRVAALASLISRNTNVVSIFDDGLTPGPLAAETEAAVLQFISCRPAGAEEDRLAA